jgi:hypothetical protein
MSEIELKEVLLDMLNELESIDERLSHIESAIFPPEAIEHSGYKEFNEELLHRLENE